MNRSRVVKLALIVVIVLVALCGGAIGWATAEANRMLARSFDTHSATFPIPFPLTEAELAELGVDADDGNRLALERAIERGRHLVEARYGCGECHGRDFAGGVMMDAAPIGSFLGPNLTVGEGSRTAGYTAADWDRIVRHGVKPDGTPALMPSTDFLLMTDRELSDIVAYLRSQPPMFGEVPASRLGPIGRLLVARGELPLSADAIEDHFAAHGVLPPQPEPTAAFGRHLAGVCTGCHGSDLAGGPIPGGDPSWPDAQNLTSHADGLAGWSYEDFVAALREAVRPDGVAIEEPMALMTPYARNMTDTELRALWAYLGSLEPKADR